MRRTEHLIYDIRESTDNLDTSGVSDNELIGYLNDGQKTIQNLIFSVNIKADLFRGEVEYPASSEGIFDLPEDILAENAIYGVYVFTGLTYIPVPRKIEAEQTSGYLTRDRKLYVSGYPYYKVRLLYFRALPKIDKRRGKIASVVGGKITLEAGYDDRLGKTDDYVTVVDAKGEKVASLFVDSFGPGEIDTSDDLSQVQAGQFVLTGKNSVSSSLLPEECEVYLKDYVRQRLYTRNNYEDAGKQVYFTDAQRADIAGLFASNQKDNLFPPITDYDSFDF